jgi:hypothetical protein
LASKNFFSLVSAGLLPPNTVVAAAFEMSGVEVPSINSANWPPE